VNESSGESIMRAQPLRAACRILVRSRRRAGITALKATLRPSDNRNARSVEHDEVAHYGSHSEILRDQQTLGVGGAPLCRTSVSWAPYPQAVTVIQGQEISSISGLTGRRAGWLLVPTSNMRARRSPRIGLVRSEAIPALKKPGYSRIMGRGRAGQGH